MNRHKEDQELKAHGKVKKQFIREQLRPQRRKNIMRILKKITLVLCAAVLFGGISALSFYIMRIYFPWEDLDESVAVVTPNRMANSSEIEERTVADEIEETTLASLEGFDKVSRQLAEIGEYTNEAVVGIQSGSVSSNGESGDTNTAQEFCGILFHETTHDYYILAEYAAARTKGSVEVTFCHGKVVQGKLAGRNDTLDLAVFCVNKADFTKAERKKIVIAKLGDVSSLALGSYVLAVGKPNGNLYSVNIGIITDCSLKLPVPDQTLRLYSMNIPYQTGRAGFVVNIQGQLLGMITTRHIPVTGEIDTGFLGLSDLAEDINGLLKGETSPYMGIYGTDVTASQAEELKLVTGIYIDTVEARSPAYQGGMRVADVITAVDGHALQTMKQLHEYLVSCQPGQEIAVTIYRQSNGNHVKRHLKITLK